MPLEQLTPPTSAEMEGGSGVSRHAARDWDVYCKQCHRRIDALRPRLLKHFSAGVQGIRALDWGCAAGGVAILMRDEFAVDMHAADVDAHSIDWLRRTRPDIHARTLDYAPSLPYADGFFDFIYGISVLTHIPAEQQEAYLAELARIARPDALVILSVHSYFACRRHAEKNRNSPSQLHDPEQLRRAGVVYRPYQEKVKATLEFVGEASYGQTYHSREYIEQVFTRHFRLLDIAEGGIGSQDVVTLARP